MTLASNHVAWIGLGKMGLPMSALVAKAGYAVTAFDRSETQLVAARGQGISIAGSATEAVSGRPLAITSLPDDAALRAVMLGPQGIVQAMAPKSILIETSTVSAEVSAEVAVAAGAREVAYLRAPMSGNASIVHTGALTCFVSGPREAFDTVKPLLANIHPGPDLSRRERGSALRQARGQPDDRRIGGDDGGKPRFGSQGRDCLAGHS